MTEASVEVPDWAALSVCVAGLGVSGEPAARTLLSLGARVAVVDAGGTPVAVKAADRLAALGADVRLGPDAVTRVPEGTRLVVTSPGWRPDQPLLAAAAAAGLPVWGEVELAWRLRPAWAGPWLALTGTNGKTTTVRMLAAILAAAGHHTIAAGNVGTPLVEAVLAQPPYDVLAVELSSFQLHWSASVRPLAAAVLNVAEDHLDWHGSFAAYAQDKARIWRGCRVAIAGADDPGAAALAADAGRPVVTFTLDEPAPGQLGLIGEALVDRAFAGTGEPVRLATLADIAVPGPHNVANALAAAALARAYGVDPAAVAAGLAAIRPEAHRNVLVATVGGVAYVDDSKATNPHAAAASLAAYEQVVWIAGGLLKGAAVDDLVIRHAHRLRAAVLIGRDRASVAEALARHAPQVPVVVVEPSETVGMSVSDVMAQVVGAASRLARPGDTVLLAPAAASMDMFTDYAERGDAFSAAACALQGRR